MQHILARQNILIRLYRLIMHGLLGLVLILPPLLGDEAQGADVQLNNAGAQTQGVLNQTIKKEEQTASDLNQRRKPNIARRERDQIALMMDIADTATGIEQIAGNRFHLTDDGTLLVLGETDNALNGGMSEIAHTDNGGEMQPMILLFQAAEEIPQPEKSHVIRINAETIKK